MDLARAFSELKSLPDVALKKELASPSGAIPGFMVLGELHERKTMRAGAGGSPDETIKRKSMADEYMGDIKSMMPMTMQGMQPPQAMPPQAMPPPQTASPVGGGIAAIPQQQGYASGGIVSLAGGGRINYLQRTREIAQELGIDPDVAVGVGNSEGGFNNPVRQGEYVKNGYREPSYGTFQLLVGGPGTGFPKGLGNRALEAGIDPRDPDQWENATRFALTEAKNKGWGQWYGAAKAGYGNWAGINGRGGGVYPSGGAAINPTAVDPNAAVAATAAETAGNMATAETAAAPAAAGDPLSQYLLMQQLFTQAQPQVQAPQMAAPVMQPQRDYRELAQETSMRPDYFEGLRYG